MNFRKSAIAVAIAFYMFSSAIHCWEFPGQPRLNRFINPVIEYLGLWRTYHVFAPNPPKQNSALAALVTYDDGSQTVWRSRILEPDNEFDRMRKMRHRKFFHDHIILFRHWALYHDAAIYIARSMSENDKSVVKVRLVQEYGWIQPPQQGIRNSPPPFNRKKVLYDYRVKPGDLT